MMVASQSLLSDSWERKRHNGIANGTTVPA
jgi:hypothetical protein